LERFAASLGAKAALDRSNNPDQAQFFPYLTGYVAFYGGDYKTAIAELGRASQEDPFILVLLAESYEKSGDAAPLAAKVEPSAVPERHEKGGSEGRVCVALA
jgi:hypothetical protein